MDITKITFKDFRNLGCINLASDNTNGLSNTLKLNGGGLIVLLGANNEGKSNVLDGLSKLGRFYEDEALNKEKDKPNFYSYEGLPRIIAHLEDTLEQAQDDFSDKTYNITFTKGVIEKGLENHPEIGDEATYKAFLQKLLESDKTIVYGKDQEGTRDEIKIFLAEHNLTLCCSATNGGRSLQCFSILENKSCESIKDFDRATTLRCGFVTNGSKGTNDASELREYLKNFKKNIKEKYQLEMWLENGSTRYESNLPQIEDISELTEEIERIITNIKNLDKTLVELDSGWNSAGWRRNPNRGELHKILKQLEDSKHNSGEAIQAYEKFHTFFQDNMESLIETYKYKLKSKNIDLEPRSPSALRHLVKIDEAFPQIYHYKQSELKDDDLESKPNDFQDSAFFKALFAILGEDTQSTIRKIYEDHKNTPHLKSYLTSAQKELNKLVQEKIDRRFNELYCLEQVVYHFELGLETGLLSFMMYKNDEVLELSKQSVGFRKFFALFFNFLYRANLKSGDIVLIDEAEAHLSVPAQRDFRKFLKDFGQNQGIIFIIATHSPYMLDSDYLDEIRIVKNLSAQDADSMGYKGTAIINDFSVIAEEDADTLHEIRKALGTNFTPDDRVIFVEGISDYNYLTAFKNLYKQEKGKIDLAFLPIAGVGRGEEGKGISKAQEQKLKAILKFAKSCRIANPILLVDNDGAGKSMEDLGKGEFKKELSVLNLAEFAQTEGIKDIESLFSNEEQKRFGILTSDEIKEHKKNDTYQKDMSKNITSRRFKYSHIKEVSKETKERFFTLLESLKKYEAL